jgi:mRNA-degrading endonuclease RelE of RelBE toxin-antitoxin system
MHRATERFWKYLENLPDPIQRIAKRNFQLLKTDPSHPSLHFKKVGKFWSARIGLDYRALAIKDKEDFIWVWIGTHDDYTRIMDKK